MRTRLTKQEVEARTESWLNYIKEHGSVPWPHRRRLPDSEYLSDVTIGNYLTKLRKAGLIKIEPAQIVYVGDGNG